MGTSTCTSAAVSTPAATITAAHRRASASTRTALSGTQLGPWAARWLHPVRAPPWPARSSAPAFAGARSPDAIDAVIDTFQQQRQAGERFIDAEARLEPRALQRSPPTLCGTSTAKVLAMKFIDLHTCPGNTPSAKTAPSLTLIPHRTACSPGAMVRSARPLAARPASGHRVPQ